MKQYADEKRHHEEFLVGGMVFLKLQPYRQCSLAQRKYEKLVPRFYGPYKVLQRIGSVANRLDLPPSISIHPVFHVSQFRQAKGDIPVSASIPPQLTADLELQVEPENLLAVRPTFQFQADFEILLKWKYLPDFEATWEKFSTIPHQFPDFHLKNKVNLWAGGIARLPIHLTYQRQRSKAIWVQATKCCPTGVGNWESCS